MINKYIHIGYPKNFSTSLQRDYFSKHPELNHLGIGLGNNLGYKDACVEKAFEVYLKTAKDLCYDAKKKSIITHFNALFNTKDSKYKAIGVSSEHLSFAFSYDGLSVKEKAKRLYEVFGSHTKIIMIVRDQFELIKSLYKESVRVGFIGDFELFSTLIYKYQDRNFIYDLRYDLVYTIYSNLFGSDNIGVFFFEDYRETNGKLIREGSQLKLLKDLNTFLGVSQIELDFEHYNEAIPSDKILTKANLNKFNRHDLGNHLLESAEKHRIKTYLEDDLDFYEEEHDTYSDVLIKRKLIQLTHDSEDTKPINFNSNPKIAQKLKSFYEEGNILFGELLNSNLPESYTKLKF